MLNFLHYLHLFLSILLFLSLGREIGKLITTNSVEKFTQLSMQLIDPRSIVHSKHGFDDEKIAFSVLLM